MKVKFTYTQILPTAHPEIEITVNFYGDALILKSEKVLILTLSMSVQTGFDTTQGEVIPLPDESKHAGAMFAGLLREAARNETHRISKQAVREAAQKQTI